MLIQVAQQRLAAAKASLQLLTKRFGSLRQMFVFMDKDRSKTLTRDEFVAGVEQSGVALSEVDIALVFKALDTDGNGTLSFKELCRRFPDRELRADASLASAHAHREGASTVHLLQTLHVQPGSATHDKGLDRRREE